MNDRIDRKVEASVWHNAAHPEMIDGRLWELASEWNIERALEDNAATLALTGVLLGAVVLDCTPVADRLHTPGVVAMRADWTRPEPRVTAYLQGFGRYGVPLNVVYGRDVWRAKRYPSYSRRRRFSMPWRGP